MSRIDEAQGQLCDLTDEEPLINLSSTSKAEVTYLFEKIIPFFINGQAAINSEKRSMANNYHQAKAELETKGT